MATREVEAGRAYILIRLRNQVSGSLLAIEREFLNFGRTLAMQSGAFAAALKVPTIWMLKLAGDYEKAQVRMEHFVGSAAKAGDILKELQAFDVVAPMDFNELVNATQLLLGFGDTAAAVVKHVKQLGDISGGDSERFQRLALALGQVITAGNLMGTEARQFAEAGWNPLESLAQMTGKTMAEMREMMGDRQITPDMVFAALDHATGPLGRFNHLLVDQAKTLPGLVSVLWSYIKLTAMDIGFTILDPAKELVAMAIDGMKYIRQWVKDNKELVGTIMKVIVAVAAAAGVLFGIGMASMALGSIIGILRSSITLLITPIAMLFAWMFQLPSAIVSVVMAIAPLVTAIGGLLGTLFFTPLGWGILTGILLATAAAAIFKDQLLAAYGSIKNLFSAVMGHFGRLQTIFTQSLFGAGLKDTGIIAALKAGHYTAAYKIAMLALKTAGLTTAAFLEGRFATMLESFGAIGRAIAGIVRALVSGQFTNAMLQFGNLFHLVITNIKNMFIDFWEWLKWELNTAIDDMLIRLANMPGVARALGLDANQLTAGRDARTQNYKDGQKARDAESASWGTVIDFFNKLIGNNSGGDLNKLAGEAWKELAKALYEQHVADKKKKDDLKERGDAHANSSSDMVGKLGSTGTFSTFGATLLGQGPGLMQQVANNTAATARILARLEKKQERAQFRKDNRIRAQRGWEPLRFNDWKTMDPAGRLGFGGGMM